MIRKIMGDGGEIELVLFSKLSYFVGKSDTVDIAWTVNNKGKTNFENKNTCCLLGGSVIPSRS